MFEKFSQPPRSKVQLIFVVMKVMLNYWKSKNVVFLHPHWSITCGHLSLNIQPDVYLRNFILTKFWTYCFCRNSHPKCKFAGSAKISEMYLFVNWGFQHPPFMWRPKWAINCMEFLVMRFKCLGKWVRAWDQFWKRTFCPLRSATSARIVSFGEFRHRVRYAKLLVGRFVDSRDLIAC